MLRRPEKVAGDEITVARLVMSLVVLVAGSFALNIIPLVTALYRLGPVGTALLVLGIAAASIGFFWAYERLTPSSPATPRRDLAVILFAGLLIGMWAFLLTNVLGTFLVLAGFGAIILSPQELRQRLADRLPWI